MDEYDCLAEQFEANRPHLRAVAYRMLGSLSERTMPCRNPGSASIAPARVASRIWVDG